MLQYTLALFVAKSIRFWGRLLGKNGSALPGYVIEKMCPNFLQRSLRGKLPLGVIVVVGTNGKTTTTRMIVQLLASQGYAVMTNASGSNLTRGIISTVVEKSTILGSLTYDVAVLEVDEAYAPHICEEIRPDMLVALNVLRDQLDRYGEIDVTARYIAAAAAFTKKIVSNGNDMLLRQKLSQNKLQVVNVGFSAKLQHALNSEATLYQSVDKKTSKLDAVVEKIETTEEAQLFTLGYAKKTHTIRLPLLGTHNVFNASMAFVAVSEFLEVDAAESEAILAELSRVSPAFGRGETLAVDSKEVTIALVKNPAGFAQNMVTFVRPEVTAILIIINDKYADGRDVSWLWDAQIGPLEAFTGRIYIAGIRRYDMALRLKYQSIDYTVVDTDSAREACEEVFAALADGSHLLVVPTYTAMLQARGWLARKTGTKRIW